MKIALRAFVVALAITGFAAASHVSALAQTAPNQVSAAKSSAFPVPMCPPTIQAPAATPFGSFETLIYNL